MTFLEPELLLLDVNKNTDYLFGSEKHGLDNKNPVRTTEFVCQSFLASLGIISGPVEKCFDEIITIKTTAISWEMWRGNNSIQD